jgi:aminomethyltransferase
MPVGTPFHPRTLALSQSLAWRDWAGYFAASSYETHHAHEYNAIRNAVALIDVSPLFKYRLRGPGP